MAVSAQPGSTATGSLQEVVVSDCAPSTTQTSAPCGVRRRLKTWLGADGAAAGQRPTPCGGAGDFVGRIFLCCGAGVGLPLLLMLLGYVPRLGGALLAAAVAYFLYSLRATFKGGVCCKPAAPPKASPFVQHAGETVAVKKVVLIYNPHGGYGRSSRLLKEEVMPEWAGLEVEVLKTECVGLSLLLALPI